MSYHLAIVRKLLFCEKKEEQSRKWKLKMSLKCRRKIGKIYKLLIFTIWNCRNLFTLNSSCSIVYLLQI